MTEQWLEEQLAMAECLSHIARSMIAQTARDLVRGPGNTILGPAKLSKAQALRLSVYNSARIWVQHGDVGGMTLEHCVNAMNTYMRLAGWTGRGFTVEGLRHKLETDPAGLVDINVIGHSASPVGSEPKIMSLSNWARKVLVEDRVLDVRS